MIVDPAGRSNEEIAREIVKPAEDLLDKETEELKKVDDMIHELERKSKPILDPDPL